MAALMGNEIPLPENIWNKISLCWVLFFILIGAVNLYIVFNYNTNIWVNFKTFVVPSSMLIFAIGQAVYIAKNSDQ
jgi:intracellular septation protein